MFKSPKHCANEWSTKPQKGDTLSILEKIHPRKKSKDPIAQLLLAMLIAQEKNDIQRPLYGCAVIAENWYFMVLDDKTYSVSNGYIAANPDGLQSILLILRKFKHILNTELAI